MQVFTTNILWLVLHLHIWEL